MSKRGRPPQVIERRPTTVALQQKYLDTFEKVCHDPFFNKRKHGLRNEIIEKALDDYWKKLGIKVEEKGVGGDGN